MQIVSKPIFWKRYKKYFKMSSAENITQSAKVKVNVTRLTLACIMNKKARKQEYRNY